MSIVTKCMQVNLQIGMWTGQRLDKDASERVTAEASAHKDAARVNKHLIPKEMLAPITKAQTQIRAHFYKMTLPWKDNGDRVLMRALFSQFIEEHERLVKEFKDAVTHFVTEDYPRAKDQAAFRMGELFNPLDYPSPYAVERRFYVNLDMDPVAEANDFRVDLSEEELDKVHSQMERAMKSRIARAMDDVWARVLDIVGHYATTMADADKVFRDTTVTNLKELVQLLPALNVMEDAQLERVRSDMERYLAGVEPKELRTNPTARAAAATEAQKIVDTMKGFMGAFGGMKNAA